MSEAAPNPLKIKALELANRHNAPPDEVVKRAHTYHGFLAGSPAATASTKPADSAAKPGAATTAKPGAATTAKPGAATTAKPGAAAKPTTAAKPGAATTAKPGAAAKPTTAAKPGAATAAKPGAASDDGLVMEDVSKALQSVLNAGTDRDAGKKKAYQILKDVGSAGSVRDVKPGLYKAVIDACAKALATPAPAPAADEAEDDFGADPVPISADENAVDTDPPEQTGGGADAEDI
jgi:hypothetical protein